MTGTGFNHERAVPHEERIGHIVTVLEFRGYSPRLLDADGDKPDIAIRDVNGAQAFVDAKTVIGGKPNLLIKRGALTTFWQLTLRDTPVYIVWDDATVDDVFTLTSRIIGGPRRATGRGSRTDWVLVKKGGSPFNEFFPDLSEAVAA